PPPRAAAEAFAARLERLQRVTAELTAAADVETVADVVVRHAVDALGAIMGALVVLVDDDTLWTVGMLGGPPDLIDRWRTFPVSADVPAAIAVRENRPIVVPTLAELERDYPVLAGHNPNERASVAVPLSIGDRRVGVITMTYPPGANVGDKTDVTFLTALADAAAQAVDRAAYRRAEIERTQTLERLVESESQARRRTAFLAAATTALSSSLERSTTIDRLIDL
nr:GAF domain-containing protein [Micromonospora sp. DSM 115978]